MYIGYVSLDKIMSYADFKKYVDKQDLAEVWCAVQVAELEKEEEGVVNFQSNIPNIGFVKVKPMPLSILSVYLTIFPIRRSSSL